MANDSKFIECMSLNNHSSKTRPTLIDLNPEVHSQILHYYAFMVNLDRCNGSWYTLDNLPSRIGVPNKKEDANLSVFSVIPRINESKTLTKDISCKCKCKLDGRKYNSKIQENIICV